MLIKFWENFSTATSKKKAREIMIDVVGCNFFIYFLFGLETFFGDMENQLAIKWRAGSADENTKKHTFAWEKRKTSILGLKWD